MHVHLYRRLLVCAEPEPFEGEYSEGEWEDGEWEEPEFGAGEAEEWAELDMDMLDDGEDWEQEEDERNA